MNTTVTIIQKTLTDLVGQACLIKSAIYRAIPGSANYWKKVAEFRSIETTIEAVKYTAK
jgi:hypothetical protein